MYPYIYIHKFLSLVSSRKRSMGFGTKQAWAQISTLASHVILAKLFTFVI